MDHLQAMRIFAAVAEKSSFTQASQQLGLSAGVATRHVSELESYLGTRLLNRTTRRISLTEAGETYLRQVNGILRDVEAANAIAMSHSELPRGTLQIYGQLSFGEAQLPRLLACFKAQYPDIALDVTLTDRTLDLVDEGFDVGFFLSVQRFDATMIARKLGSSELVLCASPDYIGKHGAPGSLDDLAHHACLNFSYEHLRQGWFIDGPQGRIDIPIRTEMVSNNGELLRQCAVHGMGIALRPGFALRDDLTSGRLVRLFPGLRLGQVGAYMVYPSRRHMSAKLASFVDFIHAWFPHPESDPWSARSAA